tara:strand:- start:376324 stop:377364 length:1041 start_codon:yes stop_codon:yes gene_type:complete
MLTSKNIAPIIMGFDGYTLTPETRELFLKLNPAGYILFKRNCKDAEQVKALCAELGRLSPFKTPLIFIDQEGGRVNRIHWDPYMGPTPREIGKIYEQSPEKGLRAAELNAYLIARQLRAYGITANCAPVADLLIEGADDVIGDRAFSADPKVISALCAASIKGLMAGGVWPVIKHVPGHGRAMADSHKELPVVDAPLEELKKDFEPFKVNNQCPFLMTAHVRYTAVDEGRCATVSSRTLNGLIREDLGMNGLIIADDMFMEALEGSLLERIESSLSAGCDLVICGSTSHLTGEFTDKFWQQIKNLPTRLNLTREAKEKLENLPQLPSDDSLDADDMRQEISKIMAA